VVIVASDAGVVVGIPAARRRRRALLTSSHEYYVLQRLVDKIARFCGFLICPIYESNDQGAVPIPDAEALTKNVPVLRILHWSDYPFHGYASLYVSTENGCRWTSSLTHGAVWSVRVLVAASRASCAAPELMGGELYSRDGLQRTATRTATTIPTTINKMHPILRTSSSTTNWPSKSLIVHLLPNRQLQRLKREILASSGL